jgi:hypothetical protein
MVPGISEAFDGVDCALEASALGLPVAPAPKEVPAVVHALPAAPAVPVAATQDGGRGGRLVSDRSRSKPTQPTLPGGGGTRPGSG